MLLGWIELARPCFLGCTTIDMKYAMVQLMKWSSGLLQVGLSRFNPLIYGVSRMSILHMVTWWNEQRIYIIKCISALLFGCLDVMMKSVGVAKANFRLTNKVVDQEKLAKYENGTFVF